MSSWLRRCWVQAQKRHLVTTFTNCTTNWSRCSCMDNSSTNNNRQHEQQRHEQDERHGQPVLANLLINDQEAHGEQRLDEQQHEPASAGC